MVTDFRHGAQVVRDEEDRAVDLGAEVAQEVQDLCLKRDIERGGDLVRDQQRGSAEKSHGDGDPLAHSTRKLVRVPIKLRRRIRDTDFAQHLDGPIRQGGPAEGPVAVLGVQEMPADGPRRIERGHRILEHHRDGRAAQRAHPGLGQARDVMPADADRAARHPSALRQKADERERQGRLARAAFADHAQDLPGVQVKRNVPQREDGVTGRPEGHGKPFDAGDDPTHVRPLRFGSSRSLSASPRKVKPSVARMIGRPPAKTIQGASRIEPVPSSRIRPQDGAGRGYAETEIGKPGLKRDDGRHVHAGDDQHRADDIGQDVDAEDAQGRGAERAQRKHIVGPLGREGRTADQPGIGRDQEQHDQHHQRACRGAEQRDECQAKDHGGEGIGSVEDQKQKAVEPARAVARKKSKRSAEDHRDRDAEQPDLQGQCRSGEHAAEDVAPELVGAHQMFP